MPALSRMHFFWFLSSVASVIFIFGCSRSTPTSHQPASIVTAAVEAPAPLVASADALPPGTVYQTAPIGALLGGLYNGDISVSRLLTLGDFGIGTFNGLDGEMIIADGHCWQVTSTGLLRAASNEQLTPWAAVTRFVPQKSLFVINHSPEELLASTLDRFLPSDNRGYAIRIHGNFTSVKVRSFPVQNPPFSRLGAITNQQHIFDHVQIQGTCIGFRMPAWSQGFSIPGYHFHFIDQAHTIGGHVLAAAIDTVTVDIMDISDLRLSIPLTDDFSHADLSDHGAELQQVEQ